MIEREPKPIDYKALVNPAEMPHEVMIAYFREYEKISKPDHVTFIFYQGTESLANFMSEGKVGIGALVEVYNYGAVIDPYYILTRNGWTRFNGEDNTTIHDPEEFLNKMDNGGLIKWTFSGHEFMFDDETQSRQGA